MKKDLKKTGLFAIVVSLFLAFVIYEINEFKKEEDVKEVKDRVVQLEAEKIDRIEYQNFILENNGMLWRSIEGEFKDILNNEKVGDWLSKSLGQDGRPLSEPKEDVDWSKFGFDEQSRSLTFKSGEKSTKITLSSMKSFDGGAYLKVSTGKDSTVLYSSGQEWFDFFDKDLKLLRSMKAFDWSLVDLGGQPKKIKAKKDAAVLDLSKESGEWTSKTKKYKNWSFDDSKVSSFIDDVKGFRLKEFVSERPKGLKRYGDLTVVTDKYEHKLDIYIKDKAYYAESNFREGVLFSLGFDNVDTFFNSAWDLRSYDDALSFNQDKVQSLSYKQKNLNYNFNKSEEGEWSFVGELPEGQEFNGASVLKLFSLMKNVSVERYLSKKSNINKSPALSIVRTDNENSESSFSIYKEEIPCIENDKKNKDCFILESNKLHLAIKKDEIKDIMDLIFFKEQSLKKAEIKDKGVKEEKSASEDEA